MNTSNLVITTHARAQFVKRCAVAYPSGVRDPESTMSKLLKRATRGHINLNSYLNRQARHGREAEYWFADVWRFVIIDIPDGKKLLLTCELKDYELNKQVKFMAAVDAVSNEGLIAHGA
jgi:hypothetical protein